MNLNNILYQMLVGTTIENKYHLKKLLGSGGFGAVFEADEVVRDRYLRTLALKVILPLSDPNLSPEENEKRQDKQLEELVAAVNLDHPHLIRCFGAGEFQFNGIDLLYLLMELADFSLQDCIRQTMLPEAEREPKLLELSEDVVWQMVGDVASGLDYFHQTQRRVHRDLKPGNILRVGSHWKVSDFGLVRSLGTASYAESSQIAGTTVFMPPEAFDGKNYPVGDIWALGIVTIAALKRGDLPYEFAGETQLLKKVMDGEVVIPALPTQFDDLVRGCLHIDPKQRWQASQVLAAVRGNTVKPAGKQPSASEPPIIVSEYETPAPQRRQGEPALTTFSFETVTVDRRGIVSNRQSGKAQQYVEDLGNGINLEMVAIPGGTFWMGSEEDNMEEPQHQVSVPPFYMGKYPVTQAQWQTVVRLPKVERDLKLDPSVFKGDNRPVEMVSWYDAVEFCARLATATGKNYHLPSEAQWEYACRAGTTTPFYCGETLTAQLVNYYATATYAEESKGEYRKKTTSVGSFPPNAFGLFDMHGNVWEWCADPWHENYEGAPNNGSVWDETLSKNDNCYQNLVLNLNVLLQDFRSRIVRGGSWQFNADNCRSAFREGFNPKHDYDDDGFRVVWSGSRTL